MASVSFPTPYWLCRSLLLLLIILGLINVTISEAQQQQHKEEKTCPKIRTLYSTIWGGVITTATLAFDTWADSIYLMEGNRYAGTILLLLMPFLRMHLVIYRASITRDLSKALHSRTLFGEDVNLSEYIAQQGDNKLKQRIKILIACKVYISLKPPTEMNEPQKNILGKDGKEITINSCEKIQEEIKDSLEWPFAKWNLQEQAEQQIDEKVFILTPIAKVACLTLTNVVPHLEELKRLRTSNRLGTLLGAIQALGYFVGIIERLSQNMEISPIEAIAFIFSILVLFQAALYLNITCTCQRSLIIHLNEHQTCQLLNILNHNDLIDKTEKLVKGEKRLLGALGVLLFLVVGALLIGYGFHSMASKSHCTMCSLSALLFLLSIIFTSIFAIIMRCKDCKDDIIGLYVLGIVSILMYMSSYMVGTTWSVLKWEDIFNKEVKPITQWIIPHFE